MIMIRNQWFRVAVLAAMLTGAGAAQTVTATIDATHTALPITKLIFGGFMEPATTRVWAEMLTDRRPPDGQRAHPSFPDSRRCKSA